MVRLAGLEPATGKTPADFKPAAYANFATAAPATRHGQLNTIARLANKKAGPRGPAFSVISIDFRRGPRSGSCGAASDEVIQDGDNGQDQENMNEADGHVKCEKAQQPHQ